MKIFVKLNIFVEIIKFRRNLIISAKILSFAKFFINCAHMGHVFYWRCAMRQNFVEFLPIYYLKMHRFSFFIKKSMNFRNLAQIETDFSEILHTRAVFHAEQNGNHADQKSLRSISKKHNSSPKTTKFLNFAEMEAPKIENW